MSAVVIVVAIVAAASGAADLATGPWVPSRAAAAPVDPRSLSALAADARSAARAERAERPLRVAYAGPRADAPQSAQAGPAAAAPAIEPRQARAPTAEELGADVAALAAPGMEGRGSGTAGGELAARYIADRLAAIGLTPGGDGSTFYQSFVVGSVTHAAAGTELARAGGSPLALGTDWAPHGGSQPGEVTGEVVFVGHGAEGSDGSPGDYAGDVAGKIALALDGGAPGATTPPSRLDKLIAARRHGAAALLIAGDTLPALEATGTAVHLVSGAVTRAAADRLIAPGGRSLADLAGRAGAVPTGVRARLVVRLDRWGRRAANVVGVLPGTDPALAGQTLVLGAHYDHLGRASGVLYPGADDNASGTSMVLGLARAFAAAGGAPRTLVVALFAGEEIGLLGSAHYVRHPVRPLDRTVAMLNFDMVGRLGNGRLSVAGVESGAGLRALVAQAGTQAAGGADVSAGDSPYGPSDHASFYGAGVPVLFFHTGGHADYHGPGDTADKIDAAGMARIARVALGVAERLASALPPAYAKVERPAPAERTTSEGGRAFLGVSVDGRSDGDGVRLGAVIADSGAERAGLRDGDVIVRLGGRPLVSFADLKRALAECKPGDSVALVYLRDGVDRTTAAVLGARP